MKWQTVDYVPFSLKWTLTGNQYFFVIFAQNFSRNTSN
ncbi:hypothetical protein NC99_05470 [Sunxiuqinia dokdonensis]|uniref:Uncharacterized protein n=1 Tax=Sunxiuqinia dokdonensis TaxID=1409788 RepID=A0A0L8VDL3_9BACT|nr:hypothetical protein NC99_05470 [Sunxiuqinia dokdonensis]